MGDAHNHGHSNHSGHSHDAQTGQSAAVEEVNGGGKGDKGEQDTERKHYMEVRLAFVEYALYATPEVQRLQAHLQRLPQPLFDRLDHNLLADKFQGLQEGVEVNQRFLDEIIMYQDGCGHFSVSDPMRDLEGVRQHSSRPTTSMSNRSKICSTLHQIVREWSSEGVEERAQSYDVLVEELQCRLPLDSSNRNKVKVLVPGAGLGRLVLDIAAKGYACQGNEFSYFMLFVSNFILNALNTPECIPVAAFIDSSCNQISVADMVRKVRIPDVSPQQIMTEVAKELGEGEQPDFSFTAGDWLEIYGRQPGEWDSVVTCFFIDTASVVMEYVETIFNCLKPGGVWVNMGPLLYHWAGGGDHSSDDRYHTSVELAYDEVRHIIVGYGFDIVKEELRDCNYTCNSKSMMRTAYRAMQFTALKPLATEPDVTATTVPDDASTSASSS